MVEAIDIAANDDDGEYEYCTMNADGTVTCTTKPKSQEEEFADRKKQVTASLIKFMGQLIDGCQPVEAKPVCFSTYCKRNVLLTKDYGSDRG